MTREQALDILSAFNEWRRYDGPIGQGPIMPAPREIGEAIDIAIEVLQAKESSQHETENMSVWTIEQLKEKDIREEDLLSTRTKRCLYQAGVYDVCELAGWTKWKVCRIRGFGKKAFNECVALLRKYELTWGMWESQSCKNWKWS